MKKKYRQNEWVKVKGVREKVRPEHVGSIRDLDDFLSLPNPSIFDTYSRIGPFAQWT